MSATGTRDQVAEGLRAFIRRTQADEVIVASMIHDPAARLKSYSIAMEAARTIGLATA
jgi:alkanesulfonate monooxygenase SsuD/methylene tetrahydromethanopterin reductase-like flavin-dependent oxidoreductase (luciferase family)